jgi:predicted nucleic acid-binding protein
VLDECAAGDQTAAQARLKELEGIPVLGVTDAATDLALSLVRALSLPAKAVNDALHIAIAAAHQVEYLMTWNCTHIANAAFRERIEATCQRAGYQPPQIVTPEELLHGVSDVG